MLDFDSQDPMKFAQIGYLHAFLDLDLESIDQWL